MTISNNLPAVPVLQSAKPTGTAAATSIVLDFNTAMAAGAGAIYVTDGALQTVIDRMTGLPTTRVVGGSDTHVLTAADLVIDGTRVTLAAGSLLAGHTYSIVMGADALVSSGNLAFGGVRSTSQLQFTTAAAPSNAPALLSVDTDGRMLKAGGSIAVTLHFSTSVSNLDASALHADNASIANLSTSDGGLTWHATLQAPAGGTTAATNTLSLDMSQVHDAAGHAGSGVSNLLVYAVDTVAPHIVSPADAGPVDAAADLVIRFDEPVYWSDGAPSVRLTNHDGSPVDIALGADALSDDHTTLTISAAALQFSPGSDYTLSIVGGPTDLAGNALGPNEIAIHTTGAYDDLTPPRPVSIEASPGAGAHGVGTHVEIVVDFGEAVTLIDSGDMTLQLNNGSQATSAHLSADGTGIVFDYVVGVGDGETTGLDLANPADLAGHVEDAAGNIIGADGLAGFHLAAGIAIDVHADAPSTPHLATGFTSGDSASTTDTSPVIAGSGAEAGAHVHVNLGGTDVGTANADASGNWTWSLHGLEAGNDYSVSAYQIDLAGNQSLVSDALTLTISAPAPTVPVPPTGPVPTPPTPPTPPGQPRLAAASDSGVSNSDGITNIKTPTFTGTSAPNSLVAVYDGAAMLGLAHANAQGAWSYTVNVLQSLTDGVHAMTTRQVDVLGHLGPASGALSVTIDTAAPTVIDHHVFVRASQTWLGLTFSEKIVFGAGGAIDAVPNGNGGNSVHHQAAVLTNWDIANNAAGVASVLEMNVGPLLGLIHLTMENNAIQDVAGNVAIIGSSGFVI